MRSLIFVASIVIVIFVCIIDGRPDTGFVYDGPVTDYKYEYVSTNSRIKENSAMTTKGPESLQSMAKRKSKLNCESVLTAYPPDPKSECCGIDTHVGNKIVGGNATAIDQYPWLALLEYIDGGELKLLCGGSLISTRYVLTAAHCAPPNLLPRNVRLGEFDKSNDGPDCAPVEANGEDCTEGVVKIPIVRIIRHSNYKPTKVRQDNKIPIQRDDIALLRLKTPAPYTDFIRPICLPTVDITLTPPAKLNFTVAGWGALGWRKPKSNIKLAVDVPYVKSEKCEQIYSMWEKQICAGGEEGKDSCNGDSGGPLMYANQDVYELVGVVSYGPDYCGSLNAPAVHTKVLHYKDWIMENIVP